MRNKTYLPALTALAVFSLVFFMLFTNRHASISRGDEAIHTRVVQEMAFENGTAISPRFFNNLYLNKPPLQFWLSTPLVKILGDKNENYRLVPMLAGVGSCLVLILFSKALFQSSYPGLFAIFLALGGRQVLFDHGMRVGTMDSMLLFLTLLAMLSLWNAITTERKSWIIVTGIIVGLACLTKWVAGLLPWMVAAMLFIVDPLTRRSILQSRSRWLLAGLISILPAGLFIGIHLLNDYHDTIEALRLNIAERLVGEGFHNQEDTWLYLKTFLENQYGNALLLTLGAVASVFTIKKQETKFLLIWVFLPFALYTSLHSRLPWYYLPATPALWLLCAGALNSLARQLPPMSVLTVGIAVSIAGFSVVKNAKRVLSAETITIDQAVQAVTMNSKIPVLFVGFSPKVESSLKMSRRYLFYLNFLALHSPAFALENSVPTSSDKVLVLPYARLEEVSLPSYKSFICPESDFKRPYDRVCILSPVVEKGFTQVGTFVQPGVEASSRLAGINVTESAGRKFGVVQSALGNIGVSVDAIGSRYDQKLSLNVAATESDTEIIFNGQSLGKLAANAHLQTIELAVDKSIVVEGVNVITIRNPPGGIVTINWISLRPKA